jgi:membrane protease subunit HflK
MIAVPVVLLGLYLLTGVTQVRSDERAVVRRFGHVLDYQPGPGLWIGLPWGLERVDRVRVDEVRRVEVGYQPDADEDSSTTPPGQFLTGDHNLVNLQVIVNYAVRHDELVDYVVHANEVDALVTRATETAIAEWVAGRTVDDVLVLGKVELPKWVFREVPRRLDEYHLGISILESASVTHLLPPPQVKAAFDQVTQAQTEIRTRLNKAEQDAAQARSTAEADEFRMEQLAAAYARERILLARAEADRFEQRRQQYERMKRDNPNALTAIWWDEMGKLFVKMREGGRVDLLDHHLGPNGLDITIVTPPKKK